jgi:VanZ family protein
LIFFLNNSQPFTPKNRMSASVRKTFFEKKLVPAAYLPVIIWAVVILALSTGNGIQLPDSGISTDKLAHLAAYGLLGWLTLRALHKTGKRNAKNSWSAIALVSAYGIALEFVQWAFFPNRFFEAGDMLANSAGAFISLFLFNFITSKT